MKCRVWISSFIAGTIVALLPLLSYAQQKKQPSPPLPQKHLLIFDRCHQMGDSYNIYYYLEREIKYVMPIQGIKKTPLRTDRQKIILSGKLNCIIAEKIYELSIQSFSLTENGIPQKQVRLQGKLLEVDLQQRRINVRNTDSSDSNTFFQVSSNDAKTLDSVIGPEEEEILWMILGSSQGDHALSVFGKNGFRAKGERWTLGTDWIQTILKQRGINSNAENWDSTATFEGMYPVNNIPANMVSVHLFSKKIPHYDCKLDIAISLPVDEKINHGPIQIICDGLEIEQTSLPADQPFCNGAKFFVERRHQSLYTLTPVKK